MKTLNFTAKGILSSLLDKSKVQTIRLSFKETRVQPNEEDIDNWDMIPDCEDGCCYLFKQEKPAKFEVGEEIELVWDEKSEYESFDMIDSCTFCSENNKYSITKYVKYKDLVCDVCGASLTSIYFEKNLGKAMITEVFKIEIEKGKTGYSDHIWVKIKDMNYGLLLPTKVNGTIKELEDLARLDGFDSADEMFKTIDKIYGLETSKEFWVYRWSWL